MVVQIFSGIRPIKERSREREREREKRPEVRYVVRVAIRRYVRAQQRERHEQGGTERTQIETKKREQTQRPSLFFTTSSHHSSILFDLSLSLPPPPPLPPPSASSTERLSRRDNAFFTSTVSSARRPLSTPRACDCARRTLSRARRREGVAGTVLGDDGGEVADLERMGREATSSSCSSESSSWPAWS